MLKQKLFDCIWVKLHLKNNFENDDGDYIFKFREFNENVGCLLEKTSGLRM